MTLIESPDIGTVGVGEGSTPRLKVSLGDLGRLRNGRAWRMPLSNITMVPSSLTLGLWPSYVEKSRSTTRSAITPRRRDLERPVRPFVGENRRRQFGIR